MINLWKIVCQSAGYTSEKKVLEEFKLTFRSNERIALLGKNGSGKSTFVQTLLGITPYFQVEIEYDNQELTSLAQLRELIGIVFQFPDDQFLGATVSEELYLNLHNQGVSEAKLLELIEIFELQTLLMRSPFELSGGQKQMLAFVTTLLSSPKLLILDEATSMLDPKSKQKFLEQVLLYQQQHQIALIHITHDLNELIHFEQICYLKAGRLVFTGDYDTFMRTSLEIDNFVLPFDLAIAQRLYVEGRIQRMPRTMEDWSEVTWVLKSLI